MNILIIGEFSGFAKHLKNGFIQLGHNVSIIHNGDGFKGFKATNDDVLYEHPSNLKIGSVELKYSNVLYRQRINKYILESIRNKGTFDIIIIICDIFVSDSRFEVGVPLSYIKELHNQGAKIILTSCGADAAYLKYLKEEKFYNIAFPNGIKARINTNKLSKLLDLTSLIIPTAYDYYYTICRFLESDYSHKIPVHYVPLPISIEPISIIPCHNRKIVIYHGIIRPIRKGSHYFEKALDRIQKEFSDKVEIIVDGNMPYDKYIEVFKRMDILLDQTNAYGTGINANLGLMFGKVVFSGNEPEEESLRGYPSPVINASPNVEDIYNKLKYLILHPEKIDLLKQKSREFAIDFLQSKHIAEKYLKLLNAL